MEKCNGILLKCLLFVWNVIMFFYYNYINIWIFELDCEKKINIYLFVFLGIGGGIKKKNESYK